MLFKDSTFRNLLYTFIVVKSKKDAEYQERLFYIDTIDLENIENDLNSIPITREVNAMLLFPYVDYEAGFSFLLIANAFISENNEITIYERPNFDTFQIMRKDSLNDKEFFYLDELTVKNEFDFEFYSNYAIEQTSVYRRNEEVEILRAFTPIDDCRNDDFPDDFLVYFFKEGLNPEGMWVRGIKLKKSHIEAKLLNQPNQDFGVNMGDTLNVIVYEDENSEIFCIADLE